MRLRLVVALLLVALCGLASAGPGSLVNPGFETGDVDGWGTYVPDGGYIQVVADHWGRPPVEGDVFALLKTDGDGSYTRLWQTFTAGAGSVLSGAAFFLTTDYLPYDDNAKVWVRSGDETGPIVATLFDESVDTVGEWGETEWLPFEFVIPASGTWTLEARVSNVGDDIQDSYMGLDAVCLEGEAVLDVAIDVMPGSDVNPISTRSRGRIPVAVLGSADFDVGDVDVATVTFGPGAALPVHGAGHLEDVDGDGFLDLVLHFDARAAAFSPDDDEAFLTGRTRTDGGGGGIAIQGVDAVRVR